MKIKTALRYILPMLALALTLPGCNSKDDDSPESSAVEVSETSTAVKSFSLSRNSKVLANLDSVFFSIDLNSAQVFNADSLPVGTKVNKLVLKIGLPTVSVATLVEPGANGGSPRYIDYLSTPGDSINFSRGPVKLRVVSNNGLSEREYTIKVNVHQMEPDSLMWTREQMCALPGNVADPAAQRTVRVGDRAYCFVKGADGRVVLSTSVDPGAGTWSTTLTAFPATALIRTITAVGEHLYALDSDNTLLSSVDGLAWTRTSDRFSWLYGEYNGYLLAGRNAASAFETVLYPAGRAVGAPDGFPVEGTSELISVQTKWAAAPTAVMIGGRAADGSCSSSAWAFDGTRWMALNSAPLPRGLSEMTLLSYFTYLTGSGNWTASKYPTLVAMGGRDSWGDVSRDVFTSVDNGVTWRRAIDLLALPSYLPDFYCADALVFTSRITARSSSALWRDMPSRGLPVWLRPTPASRATAPVTSWECPYIYLFGGFNPMGNLHDMVWRGVINRLEFKPLQ